MIRHLIATTAAAAALTACASVHTTSQSLPDAAPRHYEHIAVVASTADPRVKVAAESSFVRAGNVAGVSITPGHALFLPGRATTDSEFLGALRRHGITAVLLLSDATTDAPTVTASGAAVPLCVHWTTGHCDQSMTTGHSSATSRQDKFTITSHLIDMADGQPVWVGSTRLVRNGATDGNLFAGLAKDVVAPLVQSGAVAVTP
jgi:hypothetical protein